MRNTDAAQLQRLLDANADDESVVDCFGRMLQSYNLNAAASGFLGGAGRVCSRRPHLASRVLQIPLDCLVQLGIESTDDVLAYVKFELDRRASHFVEDAGSDGPRWLETELPQQQRMLQQLLADSIRRFPAD
jgi:hypothetical protein